VHALVTRRATLEARLAAAMRARLERGRSRLGIAARTLDAVSPLATLYRGYSILQTPDGRVVRAARELEIGDEVRARTADGTVVASVVRKDP
jgi:exodeoxyribonuclease VII large subunit